MRTGAAPAAQTPRSFQLKKVIEITDVRLWPISDGPLDAANGQPMAGTGAQAVKVSVAP